MEVSKPVVKLPDWDSVPESFFSLEFENINERGKGWWKKACPFATGIWGAI